MLNYFLFLLLYRQKLLKSNEKGKLQTAGETMNRQNEKQPELIPEEQLIEKTAAQRKIFVTARHFMALCGQ